MTEQQYKLVVNGTRHEWPERCITGREIARLASVPAGDRVYEFFKDGHGERIDVDEQADLMATGVERFITVAEDAGDLPENAVRFYVDNEEMLVRDANRTGAQIIGFSGNSPAGDYVLLETWDCGALQQRHDDIDKPIKIEPDHRFAVIFKGCTPVSFVHGAHGALAFVDVMTAAGYAVDQPVDANGKSWCVVKDFGISGGRFSGKVIEIAIPVPPDFPVTPPGGLFVSPRLADEQTLQNVQVGDEAIAALGGAWQYWSRPFMDGKWDAQNPGRGLVIYWNTVFANVN